MRTAVVQIASASRRLAGQVPTDAPSSGRTTAALERAARALAQAEQALEAFSQRGDAFATRLASGGVTSTNASAKPDSGSDNSAASEFRPPGMPLEFAMIPLSQIDDSDRAITEADFAKGYTPDDLAWAHQAFIDMILPGIARGMGRDDFAELDADLGLVGTRSYADTYLGFMGPDQGNVIKLARGGAGKFKLQNGYHRVWVARRLGLTHVPAALP